MNSPSAFGYRMPAEWEKHDSVWLAWPSHSHLWQEDLEPAQEEFIEFCKAIADVDAQSSKVRGERLNVLVADLEAGAKAELALRNLPVQLHLIPFGDIWLRDTAPIFLQGSEGLASLRFQFNGWGEKYNLPFDRELAAEIAKASAQKIPHRHFSVPWVLEGGSIEVDGQGTCLTSRQCLLNPNRNPDLSQADLEKGLKESFAVQKILWLNEGLLNDHTDGHIDTIARFVAPGKALCMRASGSQDPNSEILQEIERDLRQMTDAQGQALQVFTVPSPGKVLNFEDEVMPASYLNFYISNSAVIVPTYGSDWDQDAVAEIASFFPERRTVGLSAKSILTGGGAFHCISQQQPV
ncbi:MAG: agmatine deiminase family protein [Pseudobdellovibrionaceae bacterium]